MSAGRDLAQKLIGELNQQERHYLLNSGELEIEGFLYGRFGREYSTVCLFNCVEHIHAARPAPEAHRLGVLEI
jgi:hypothetical protein